MMQSDNKTRRLFVALPVSAGFKSVFKKLPQQQIDGSWNHPDDLHITIRFLGDVDPEAVDDIAETLERVQCKQLSIDVNGFDLFENKKPILYAQVQSIRKMNNIVASVNEALQHAGFAMPMRPYIPHITLARPKDIPKARLFAKKNAKIMKSQWKAESFSLFESADPDIDGRIYTKIKQYSLKF